MASAYCSTTSSRATGVDGIVAGHDALRRSSGAGPCRLRFSKAALLLLSRCDHALDPVRRCARFAAPRSRFAVPGGTPSRPPYRLDHGGRAPLLRVARRVAGRPERCAAPSAPPRHRVEPFSTASSQSTAWMGLDQQHLDRYLSTAVPQVERPDLIAVSSTRLRDDPVDGRTRSRPRRSAPGQRHPWCLARRL